MVRLDFKEIKPKIQLLAQRYNKPEFIMKDPIQFPHRYTKLTDIEISALFSSWVSFGLRKAIIKTCENIDSIFAGEPTEYIINGEYKKYIGNNDCLYRFFKYNDFANLCGAISYIYKGGGSLGELIEPGDDYAQKIFDSVKGEEVNGISNPQKGSTCKRLHMMLRWMVRQDKIVDIGAWSHLDPKMLMVPVDIHVNNMALKLNIVNRNEPTIKSVQEVTMFMRRVFPSDPALGDFALFGMGEEKLDFDKFFYNI